MAQILVASLGESPVVVTAMYELLRKREHIDVDAVMVLRPGGDDVRLGYDMIEDALRGKCVLSHLCLPFEDANNAHLSLLHYKG